MVQNVSYLKTKAKKTGSRGQKKSRLDAWDIDAEVYQLIEAEQASKRSGLKPSKSIGSIEPVYFNASDERSPSILDLARWSCITWSAVGDSRRCTQELSLATCATTGCKQYCRRQTERYAGCRGGRLPSSGLFFWRFKHKYGIAPSACRSGASQSFCDCFHA